MSNTRRRLISALGCLLGSFAMTAPPAVVGQEANRTPSPYRLASLEGNYAVVGTYGANVARLLGTYHADGQGNIKGTAKVNLPGPGDERVVVSVSYGGTYTVNENGTGTIYFTVVLPGGGTELATLDFVFTKSEVLDGIKVATEIATAQREPSMVVNGQFVTHVSPGDLIQKRIETGFKELAHNGRAHDASIRELSFSYGTVACAEHGVSIFDRTFVYGWAKQTPGRPQTTMV